MAALAGKVTNPEAIRHVNEQLRPLSEKFRDLDALMREADATYISLGTPFATGSDTVEDNRKDEGVSRLTSNDVTSFITQMRALSAVLAQPGVMDVIRKLTVRKLSING